MYVCNSILEKKLIRILRFHLENVNVNMLNERGYQKQYLMCVKKNSEIYVLKSDILNMKTGELS